jgi:glycosyltransferase involved in cell wall biosynthesis
VSTAADDYPRVLLVGPTFESLTGGGITLSSLFRGWPKDRLAVVTWMSAVVEPGVCDSYYVLGPDEDRLVFPLSLVRRQERLHGPRTLSGDEPLREAGGRLLQAGRLEPVLSRREQRRRRALQVIERLGAAESVRRLAASPALVSWAHRFAPDLVYTQLASLNAIRLTRDLLAALEPGLVLHFMDDWPSVIYRRGLLAGGPRRRVAAGLRELVGRADLLLAISEPMATAFGDRYGRSFVAFQNAIDVDDWARRGRNDWAAGSPFRVTYTGRLGAANAGSVHDLCLAVARLVERGADIELAVLSHGYADAAARELLHLPGVRVDPPVPYADVPGVLGASDLLVLPLDFDAASVTFARYSMPTKTPEYMASGVPTLVYAPAETALAADANGEGWAEVVTRADIETLAAAIARLAADEDRRRRLGTRARELARERHDGAVVRPRFVRCLREAAMSAEGPP